MSLSNIRDALIRQEDTIIFSLIERAQFAFNQPVYEQGEIWLLQGCKQELLFFLFLNFTSQLHQCLDTSDIWADAQVESRAPRHRAAPGDAVPLGGHRSGDGFADGVPVPGFTHCGRRYSPLEYLLRETEQLHGKIRRYTSPDEQAFFPDDLPPLVLPPITYPSVNWLLRTVPCGLFEDA